MLIFRIYFCNAITEDAKKRVNLIQFVEKRSKSSSSSRHLRERGGCVMGWNADHQIRYHQNQSRDHK